MFGKRGAAPRRRRKKEIQVREGEISKDESEKVRQREMSTAVTVC